MKRLFHSLYNPITSAREKLDRAQHRHAACVGEVGYAESMVLFYESQLAQIDHTQDPWRYAEIWQKLHDMREELAQAQRAAEEAFAKAQARGDELIRLEGGAA